MGGQDRGPAQMKNPQEEVQRLYKELQGAQKELEGAQKELTKANAEVDRYEQRIKDDKNAVSNLKAEGKDHTKEMDHLRKDMKFADETLDRKLRPAATEQARRVRACGDKLKGINDAIDALSKKGADENWPHDYNSGAKCWCGGGPGVHGGQTR